VSYAQNAEDIRVWRAFHQGIDETATDRRLTYVDVGANEPRHLSITASLYDLGWRGLLIEADPQLAHDLRRFRPNDVVVEMAAASGPGELTFYRVPGTGLGTLDADEANAARARGFEVLSHAVVTDSLDSILDDHGIDTIHFMSIDVEGAESIVLSGLSLAKHRPWVVCIEAVYPGTSDPSHGEWESTLLDNDYLFATFDGINRWYVAKEHADLLAQVSLGLNTLDIGVHGWVQEPHAQLQHSNSEAYAKNAWQRELILNDVKNAVPTSEYEKQIHELRTALVSVEGSRSWKYSRKVSKAARIAQHKARVAITKMPSPIQKSVVRSRHLKHVNSNIEQLIDPAYLGKAPAESVDWIAPDNMPALPGAGFSLTRPSRDEQQLMREWLSGGPYDTDALLEKRTDNHDDELGRVISALRLRLAIADKPIASVVAPGAKVLFDARSLQTAAFGTRGIGRFARSALEGARATLGDDKLVLLVDNALEILPADLAGTCEQITRVTEKTAPRYSVLIQPSPMTAHATPLVPLLHTDAHKIAIVFDFIPMHYPTVYLRHAGARVEYASALDALTMYDEFVCISHMVKSELSKVLGRTPVTTSVAWPDSVGLSGKPRPGSPDGPIVIMTGDEGRKNTYGALAAVAVATAGIDEERDVLVIGMAGQETRVHHWSIHAAMRPGEAVTAGRLSDQEMTEALRSASVVLVSSFDEGLSLPVIEAIAAGANVVASDIPAHRELIGSGSYLVDPKNLKSFARTIRKYAKTRRSFPKQSQRLLSHQHDSLETTIGRSALAHLGKTSVGIPESHAYIAPASFSVGFATPWSPQKSGIADFSATVGRELAKICELTVYTTADAQVDQHIKSGTIDSVLAHGSDHDSFVSVIGNSHFHVPFIEVMKTVDSVAVAHDTRMIEFYAALRGRGGVEQLMLRGQRQRVIAPPFDEQLDDMRLLQNAGLWEIARQSRILIMHSPSTADRIAEQIGITPRLLPFAAYRIPDVETVTQQMRDDARARLGWEPGTKHIATFGYVDIRTKLVDVIVEAGAWLKQWGHDVHLHLIGAATPGVAEQLTRQAREAGMENFEITGFTTDDQYRDCILGVNLGIQLRVSPFLGVSGPLADMAAYGTPGMGSNGLAIDVDTPDFIDRLPDEVSPLMVAEAIEYRLARPIPADDREQMRREYLAAKSPEVYARILLETVRGN
jgi:FkbM family methyltransferase